MIYCINYNTLSYFAEAYVSQFRLRYNSFIDAQYWDLSRFKGMEYDPYDTPAATYLVYQNDDGEAIGSVRVSPTDRPYAIKDLWPEMAGDSVLPESMSVWEASRFCVDANLSREKKQQVKNELVLALLEFGLKNDIKSMVGVMPPKFWNSVFINSGWDIEYMGSEKIFTGGYVTIAGTMPISVEILERVRRTTHISQQVLLTKPINENKFIEGEVYDIQSGKRKNIRY